LVPSFPIIRPKPEIVHPGETQPAAAPTTSSAGEFSLAGLGSAKAGGRITKPKVNTRMVNVEKNPKFLFFMLLPPCCPICN